jgi:magnesium transporter
VIVDMAVYDNGVRRAGELKLDDAFEACHDRDSFVWIGLYRPSEQEFEAVRREFELHELAVEDAIKAHQRPKLEVYEDSIFVVLKTAHYDEEAEAVETGEIQLFLGPGFVITVRHDDTDLHPVREQLESRPDLMRCGPGAVLHAVLDKVVDDYLPVIEAVDHDIREVEVEVFSPSRENPAERIYKLLREVLELHDAVAPLSDPVERLERAHFRIVTDELRPYFRDVKDHVMRAVREIDGFRELLTNVLSANLTQVSVRQNDDVRKISSWAAIIAVPTLITGIYGMNFEHMPELGWTFGYPLALAAMGLACLLLYRAFKRAGWL